ncbi:MAG: hypothetical protein NVS4B3_09670 [Gemmatimonadaceae bacterium]
MTMIEMLFVISLLGLVMAVTLTVVTRQQRFFRSASDIGKVRGQLAQALDQLPPDLRSISAAGGDVYAWSDKSLEFRSFSGLSALCSIPATRDTLILPPTGVLARGNTLTSWLNPPVVGDSVLVFDDGGLIGAKYGQWRAYGITSVASVTLGTGCLPSSGLITAIDSTSLSSWRLGVSPALNVSVVPGAPVRIFRRVHYELYQASNGSWYLGGYDCLSTYTAGVNGNCATLSPLSGPYQPYSSTAANSGFSFTYFDTTGTALDPATAVRANIAQIKVTARGQTNGDVNLAGVSQGTYVDSLTMNVGLRNRY